MLTLAPPIEAWTAWSLAGRPLYANNLITDMSVYKAYLAIGRLLFGKPFVEGQKVVYEGWEPSEGAACHYPDVAYSKPQTSMFTFSKWQVDEYKKGRERHIFAMKEHALEASRRCLEVLKAYHEELGY